MVVPTRLIAIGFDAAPWSLVERWTAAGELPVLARLLRDGGRARLDSHAFDLPESCWPTIARGCGPGRHGYYNWRGPGEHGYGATYLAPPLEPAPFWRHLREDGAPEAGAPRTLLLDVPHTQLERADGVVHVSGWGERGGTTNASSPAGELADLIERFGGYPQTLNREAADRPLIARAQLRTLRRTGSVRTQVLLDMMRRHPWELVVAALHEPHYAGHAFHVYTDPDRYRPLGFKLRLGGGLEDALLRCYQDADRGLGELLAAAPDDTHVAVFSGMGLRPATAGPLLLERALAALGYQTPAPLSSGTRHKQLARTVALKAIPRPVARAIKRRVIDQDAVDAQLAQASYEATDWPATRAWAEGEPGFGYVRLNIRGREQDGCVDPDDAADLQRRIADDLLALRAVDSDDPVIDAVLPIEEVVGPDPHPGLPDLVVRMSTTTMALKARHPRAGVIDGGRDGYRLTEHDRDGWLVLHGPKVASGSDAGNARAEDVAPTIVQLMDGLPNDDYEGRVLDELFATPIALPRSSAPRG